MNPLPIDDPSNKGEYLAEDGRTVETASGHGELDGLTMGVRYLIEQVEGKDPEDQEPEEDGDEAPIASLFDRRK
ncbi:MAG: hypothetical protein ACD_65C00345G0011 [uncultured bacterium]|nr:MAG: hypothetical protein ACD_65C00345G0011 [uncultured bacterium]KKT01823.1 MAG: hypothetical protein UV80_C0008G0033 [Candidatus Peregrinibacteria bacterium GW2011_GWF2_43_17]HAU39499.1 hypothetical protein [Candidatus Peregrinibacteria bacterium]